MTETILAELRALRAEVCALRAELTAARAPKLSRRDIAGARALLGEIDSATRGMNFTAREVISHAGSANGGPLRAALAAACGAVDAHALGKFLSRMRLMLGDVSVERIGREHGAAIWRVGSKRLDAANLPPLIVAGVRRA